MTYAKCVVKAKSFVQKKKFKFKPDQNDNSQAVHYTDCEITPSFDCNKGTYKLIFFFSNLYNSDCGKGNFPEYLENVAISYRFHFR